MECWIEFIVEGQEDKIFIDRISLPYQPYFFVGQEIHISGEVHHGFKDIWKPESNYHYKGKILKIEQSFQKKFYHTVKQLHFMTVTIELIQIDLKSIGENNG